MIIALVFAYTHEYNYCSVKGPCHSLECEFRKVWRTCYAWMVWYDFGGFCFFYSVYCERTEDIPTLYSMLPVKYLSTSRLLSALKPKGFSKLQHLRYCVNFLDNNFVSLRCKQNAFIAIIEPRVKLQLSCDLPKMQTRSF